MRTSCHVTSAWTGTGTTASPWRPQFIVDHTEANGFEYDMLSGDPRTEPPTPAELVVRCLTDEAWAELQADPTYTPTEVVQYSNAPLGEEDPLW